jgi:ribose 5-phosphate isomerase A
MEAKINALAGVVDNGIFSIRKADTLIVGRDSGVEFVD